MLHRTAAVAVVFLASHLSAYATVYCYQHDRTQAYGIAQWSGIHNHNSGSHFLSYFPEDKCTYDDPSDERDGTLCNTNQLSDFVFMPTGAGTGDNGTVYGAPDDYHQLDPKSQIYQAYRPGAATPPHIYEAGAGINNCNIVSGCLPITVTLGPLTVTGGGAIEASDTFQFNSPGCGVRRFHSGSTACTCRACGCGSPLMMDANGLGPFGPKEGQFANFDQFTGIDKQAIWFKLKMQNGSWAKTKKQRIAWTKPGATMVILVLPNDDGSITNGDNLFGNVTHCGDQLCPDGFRALWYKCDNPLFGGNNDGFCDKNDALWYKLRWLSGRPNDPKRKLYTMQEIDPGLRIDLRKGSYYEVQSEEQFRDEHGNHARLRGVINLSPKDLGDGQKLLETRILWDVWLLDDIAKDEDAKWHK